MKRNKVISLNEWTLDEDGQAITIREARALRIFWIGIIIYTAAATLNASTPGTGSMYRAIQIFGLPLFIYGASRLISFRIENNYLKFLFYSYVIWQTLIVVRGLPFDSDDLKRMLFDGWYGMWPYFAPLVLLLPRNIFFYKRIFDVIVVLNILFIAYSLVYRGDLLNNDPQNITSLLYMEFFAKNLSIPAGFLLLTYIYHSNIRRMLAGFVIVATFVLAMIRARRSVGFMSISMLLFSLGTYFYAYRRKLINVFYAIVLVFIAGVYASKIYNQEKNTLFSLITERGDEDTRTGVEDFFYKDLTSTDWLIGRGVKGEYFCPGIDEEGFTNYRDTIETDYLNIILKGGIISLGLIVLIALPAIFKGLFRSKNVLSKAAGIWILLYLFDLYPANVTVFNLNYLLVWISIGICYSPAIRNMSEGSIKEVFSS